MSYLVTSESVTEGHPDKICDRISDAVLDAYLAKDPEARVACETLVSGGMVVITGEITAKDDVFVDVRQVAADAIQDIGYTDPATGFSHDTATIMVALKKQSGDISQGVDGGGAGDQGLMYGYATNETESFMPLTMDLAHGLARRLAEVRRDGTLSYLRPDGKSQVTIQFDDDGNPERATAVVLAAQHSDDVDEDRVARDLRKHVIEPVMGDLLTDETDVYVNKTGRFVIGGPVGDAGLTGRKIIVDTYGGVVAHGGGAFSGKDPTKVDRSAAYAARWIAKNLVAAGVADRVLLGLSYVIGHTEPLHVSVETYGTEKVPTDRILAFVKEHFDLSPSGIIKRLNLRRPIYAQTSAYGHFGRDDLKLPWEAVDEAEPIRKGLLAVKEA